MIEILAPCGGADSLAAALNTGADAVYLGMTDFSARKNAKNFTPEETAAAIRLCHTSGVKVHIAMNTLLFDGELHGAVKAAERLYEMGADALIVQDLGLARLIRSAVPALPLHASTQMTITSAAGAEFVRKAGFSRAVLARELSLPEIERIVKNIEIETEVFIHGALCVSLSGQCLMSAFYGGRSGNRGRCAQPCRLNHAFGEREYVLSLKDLCGIGYLQRLNEIGVTSAKIEGRMKRPEYVAAAVTACRAALNGEEPDLEQLRAAFSRSGFTSAYLAGSLTEMQGTRTREDVESAAPALKELKKLYEKPYKRYAADFSIRIERGKPIAAEIAVTRGGETVAAGYESPFYPEEARTRPTAREEIAERLGKLGGTVFTLGEVRCTVGEGLSVPASALNGIRRELIERITEKLSGERTD